MILQRSRTDPGQADQPPEAGRRTTGAWTACRRLPTQVLGVPGEFTATSPAKPRSAFSNVPPRWGEITIAPRAQSVDCLLRLLLQLFHVGAERKKRSQMAFIGAALRRLATSKENRSPPSRRLAEPPTAGRSHHSNVFTNDQKNYCFDGDSSAKPARRRPFRTVTASSRVCPGTATERDARPAPREARAPFGPSPTDGGRRCRRSSSCRRHVVKSVGAVRVDVRRHRFGGGPPHPPAQRLRGFSAAAAMARGGRKVHLAASKSRPRARGPREGLPRRCRTT